ncbi:MAG: TetR/AcrR family transcriptional regulator [Alphaproteobacteria bacterium]
MLDLSTADGKIIDAAMRLAASSGWAGLSFDLIATEAGVSLAEFRRHFPTKTHILAAFTRAADDAVLAKMPEATAGDTGERDRLFDVLMTRFEVMAPYKASLKRIKADLPFRPAEGLALLGGAARTQYWMLQAAGVAADGPRGAVSLPGLLGIYASTFDIWLEDDDPAQSKTMAALDTQLRRGEKLMQQLDRLGKATMQICCAFTPKRNVCKKKSDHNDNASTTAKTPPLSLMRISRR